MTDTILLVEARSKDIDELMSWFCDESATAIWGGPGFRYPFTRETFHADCLWQKMATYVLRGRADSTIAFGQLYERSGRINLARLAVNPAFRGKGFGRMLMTELIDKGRDTFELDEYSLFVRIDNPIAFGLYSSIGFTRSKFPIGAPMQDICFYMTRPVQRAAPQP